MDSLRNTDPQLQQIQQLIGTSKLVHYLYTSVNRPKNVQIERSSGNVIIQNDGASEITKLHHSMNLFFKGGICEEILIKSPDVNLYFSNSEIAWADDEKSRADILANRVINFGIQEAIDIVDNIFVAELKLRMVLSHLTYQAGETLDSLKTDEGYVNPKLADAVNEVREIVKRYSKENVLDDKESLEIKINQYLRRFDLQDWEINIIKNQLSLGKRGVEANNGKILTEKDFLRSDLRSQDEYGIGFPGTCPFAKSYLKP